MLKTIVTEHEVSDDIISEGISFKATLRKCLKSIDCTINRHGTLHPISSIPCGRSVKFKLENNYGQLKEYLYPCLWHYRTVEYPLKMLLAHPFPGGASERTRFPDISCFIVFPACVLQWKGPSTQQGSSSASLAGDTWSDPQLPDHGK